MSLKPQIMRRRRLHRTFRGRKLPKESIGVEALWRSQPLRKFVGATMVSGMIGGSPVDEDDAIAVVALTKAVEVAAGGCWSRGAGAGGAGGTAGATSAQ
jgi:hypothetical protein